MLQTNFVDYNFKNPLMNASGIYCMTVEELDELAHSTAGAFITKSSTLQLREGNPSPRYYDVPLGSINSMGLPNLGLQYYLDYAIDRQDRFDTPIFFSIAGMSVAENIEMLEIIQASDFNGIRFPINRRNFNKSFFFLHKTFRGKITAVF
jgi:dihydroorotate dehydrogenase (fumarate)